MLLLLAAAAATVAVAGGTLEGIVRGPDGAVVGAEVAVWRMEGTVPESVRGRTDGQGSVRIAAEAGAMLVVRAPGLAPHVARLETPLVTPLTIRLAKGRAQRVVVREGRKKRPLPGTRLEIMASAIPEPLLVATTDASGVAVVEALGPDPQELLVKAPGYLLERREIPAGDGRALLEVELSPGPSLEVRVADADGAAVPDAYVVLSCAGITAALTGVVDGRGRLLFTSTLPCVRYEGTVGSADRGLVVVSQRPRVEPSGLQVVEVALGRAAAVAGRVLDAEDGPVPGATIWISGSPQMARSAADGSFRLRGIDTGTVRIYVRAEGYLAPDPMELQLGAEGRPDVLLRLAAGRTFEGRVTDREQHPVAGAVLNAAAGGGNGEAETSGDGTFAVRGLGEGPVFASVSARGFQPYSADHDPGGAVVIVLERGARVVGRVVDVESSTAIAGAQVSAMGRAEAGGLEPERRGDGVTDGEGAFEIDGLEPGAYLVSADAEGYIESAGPEVRVAAGAVSREILLRLRRGTVLAGSVVAAADGLPVSGASVSAISSQGYDASVAATDAAGAFRIPGIAGAFVDVSVEHPRFAPEVLRGVPLLQAAAAPLVIRLRGFGGLHGTVRWGERVVPEASVSASGEFAQADAAGLFELDRLPPGRINLQVTGALDDRYRSVEQEVVVAEGRVLELQVDLGAGGTRVRGVVRWGGRPLAGAILLLDDATGAANPERTDANGAFVMPGVSAGPHLLVVLSGNQRFEQRVEIPAAESHALVVDIAGSRLSGRVVDAKSGEGIPASLVARVEGDPPPPVIRMESDEDGTFLMDGVAPGRIRLRAEAPDHDPVESLHTLAPGQLLDGLTIALEESGELFRLRGVVRLPDGRPAFPAAAGLVREGAFVAGPAVTDPSGAFSIPDVVPGRYDAVATMPTWGPAIARDVEVGGDVLDLTLAVPAMLRVRVHRGGEPVVAAHVVVLGLPTASEEQETSPEGLAFFAELPAGTCRLRVSSGSDVEEREVTLTEGSVADVAVALGGE